MLQPIPMPVKIEKPVEASRIQNKPNLLELWKEEIASAKTKLSPEGALTGASRELQTGLGSLLNTCHEHGVKIGPWRLTHVVQELNFGDHPTYGVLPRSLGRAKLVRPGGSVSACSSAVAPASLVTWL